MKITINLTKAEVEGIKDYLKAVDDIQRPTKKDITVFINSVVGAIHSPRESVSGYIANRQKEHVFNKMA